MFCKTCKADQIQNVTTAMSGEVNVLCEIEALLQFQLFYDKFTIRITQKDTWT